MVGRNLGRNLRTDGRSLVSSKMVCPGCHGYWGNVPSVPGFPAILKTGPFELDVEAPASVVRRVREWVIR
jgi:hypothetical protein